MKKILIISFLFINAALAQDKTVSLEECYQSMVRTYPLREQSRIQEEVSMLNTRNIGTAWLPGAELAAQFTYQSDVVGVDMAVMGNSIGFEGDKDQYKVLVNIQQLIYDWGRVKSAKRLENASLKVNKQSTEVELNKVKEQLNNFFFAVLILKSNENQMVNMQGELIEKEKVVRSGVDNGVLLESDLQVMKAEIIKVVQAVSEIRNQRMAAIDVLKEITGMEISYTDTFVVSNYAVTDGNEQGRPEMALFGFQKEKLDAVSMAVAKQNSPKIYAFAQMGYGKPGLNMVNKNPDSFYYVGLGLNWKFLDWNNTKRERQVLMLTKNMVETQESVFQKQINTALIREKSNIKNMEEVLVADEEIIRLRMGVTESARAKLAQGTITPVDYIAELNKEIQARISYETHKIKLVQSKVNLLYLKGML